MWLLWTPFHLLFPSWKDAVTRLLPTGPAYNNFSRHADGFTLTYSHVLLRSVRSRARSQGKVSCPHKNGACDLDLIDQTVQLAELIFMYQITKRTEILKRVIYLALSVLLLQRRIKRHGVLTEEFEYCEHLSCSIKSKPSKDKHATLSKFVEK